MNKISRSILPTYSANWTSCNRLLKVRLDSTQRVAHVDVGQYSSEVCDLKPDERSC